MSEIKEEILQYMRNSEEPISRKEIMESLPYNISEVSLNRYLIELEKEESIIRVGSNRYSMWKAVSKSQANGENDTNIRVILDETANAKGLFEELEGKIHKVDSRIDEIHVNLITILGVFVAAFALILNNANSIYDIVKNNTSICRWVIAVIVTNISTLVVVGIMLLLIKLLFKGRKK